MKVVALPAWPLFMGKERRGTQYMCEMLCSPLKHTILLNFSNHVVWREVILGSQRAHPMPRVPDCNSGFSWPPVWAPPISSYPSMSFPLRASVNEQSTSLFPQRDPLPRSVHFMVTAAGIHGKYIKSVSGLE